MNREDSMKKENFDRERKHDESKSRWEKDIKEKPKEEPVELEDVKCEIKCEGE